MSAQGRPDLYVLARVLDRLASAPDGMTHGRLQPAVRLNYDLYRRYVAVVVDRGWARLESRDGVPERVVMTEAGRDAHARLVAWIRDAFGDVAF